jgi:hypothetical protein
MLVKSFTKLGTGLFHLLCMYKIIIYNHDYMYVYILFSYLGSWVSPRKVFLWGQAPIHQHFKKSLCMLAMKSGESQQHQCTDH